MVKMDFRLTVEGSPPLWKTTQGMNKLAAIVFDQSELMNLPLMRAYESAAGIVNAAAKRKAPVNIGILRKSITWEVKEFLGFPQYARVGTNVGYARPVHQGRMAGAKMPPVAAIAQWVSEKKILNTSARQRRKSVTSKQVQRVAFAIARSIAKKGIPPKPFLRDALITEGDKVRQAFILASKQMQILWDGG